MAGSLLKRSQAVVWLPPRAAERGPLGGDTKVIAFTRQRGQWRGALLSIDALAQIRRVILLADPRDCNLMRVTLPPLTGQKLAQALPNAVEDLLLTEVQNCALAAASAAGSDGKRLVVACDRQWLEAAVLLFEKRNAQVLAIWPATLTLPWSTEQAMICCAYNGYAVRTGPEDGIGWPAGEDDASRVDALVDLMNVLGAQLPPGQSLVVAATDQSWNAPVETAMSALNRSVTVTRIPAPGDTDIDLLPQVRARLRASALSRFDWYPWRLPAALAGATLVALLLGLNLHWMQMANEAKQLRSGIEQKFRQSFPETTAVVDPLLQMRRQVASLRAQGGVAGNDDFVPLLGRFGAALGTRANDALSGLEYRDGALKVTFKSGVADTESARDQLRQSCTQQGLVLQFEAGREQTATVRVRS